MGKKVFDEKTSLWKNFLSLIIFMRNEIRRAIYSTDHIKSISIYFLSSSIGIMRQIYNHIQIEEYKCFRQIDMWMIIFIFTMVYILRLQIKLKVLEDNKKYEKSKDTKLFKIFKRKAITLTSVQNTVWRYKKEDILVFIVLEWDINF